MSLPAGAVGSIAPSQVWPPPPEHCIVQSTVKANAVAFFFELKSTAPVTPVLIVEQSQGGGRPVPPISATNASDAPLIVMPERPLVGNKKPPTYAFPSASG